MATRLIVQGGTPLRGVVAASAMADTSPPSRANLIGFLLAWGSRQYVLPSIQGDRSQRVINRDKALVRSRRLLSLTTALSMAVGNLQETFG